MVPGAEWDGGEVRRLLPHSPGAQRVRVRRFDDGRSAAHAGTNKARKRPNPRQVIRASVRTPAGTASSEPALSVWAADRATTGRSVVSAHVSSAPSPRFSVGGQAPGPGPRKGILSRGFCVYSVTKFRPAAPGRRTPLRSASRSCNASGYTAWTAGSGNTSRFPGPSAPSDTGPGSPGCRLLHAAGRCTICAVWVFTRLSMRTAPGAGSDLLVGGELKGVIGRDRRRPARAHPTASICVICLARQGCGGFAGDFLALLYLGTALRSVPRDGMMIWRGRASWGETFKTFIPLPPSSKARASVPVAVICYTLLL